MAAKLPDYLQKYITHLSGNNNRLSMRDWAMGELNVPGYPESRIYRRLGEEVCRLSDNSPDLALYIREKTTLHRRGRDSSGHLLWGRWPRTSRSSDSVPYGVSIW